MICVIKFSSIRFSVSYLLLPRPRANFFFHLLYYQNTTFYNITFLYINEYIHLARGSLSWLCCDLPMEAFLGQGPSNILDTEISIIFSMSKEKRLLKLRCETFQLAPSYLDISVVMLIDIDLNNFSIK